MAAEHPIGADGHAASTDMQSRPAAAERLTPLAGLAARRDGVPGLVRTTADASTLPRTSRFPSRRLSEVGKLLTKTTPITHPMKTCRVTVKQVAANECRVYKDGSLMIYSTAAPFRDSALSHAIFASRALQFSRTPGLWRELPALDTPASPLITSMRRHAVTDYKYDAFLPAIPSLLRTPLTAEQRQEADDRIAQARAGLAKALDRHRAATAEVEALANDLPATRKEYQDQIKERRNPQGGRDLRWCAGDVERALDVVADAVYERGAIGYCCRLRATFKSRQLVDVVVVATGESLGCPRVGLDKISSNRREIEGDAYILVFPAAAVWILLRWSEDYRRDDETVDREYGDAWGGH
jgi:hypothetical protein